MPDQAAVSKGASSTEQWLDATLDQVFLTPRVIDERSYEELAGSLRTLMKDAAGQSRALITTTGEVKLLGDQLREATQQLQAKVDTAVRVIPTLDQRVAKAEALLEVTGKELQTRVTQMQEVAANAVPMERERIATQLRAEAARLFEEITREQVAALRGQLEGELAIAKKRAEEQASSIMALITGAQGELEKSVAAFEERSWAAASRMERQLATIEETLEKVAATATRAETARTSLESSAAEAGVRLGTGIAEAERRMETISLQAEVCVSALSQQVDQARSVDLTAQIDAAKRLEAVVVPEFDEETLRKLGLWLQQLVMQGDQIGRGLSALIQRAGPLMEKPAAGRPQG
jgi:hypothetical protein